MRSRPFETQESSAIGRQERAEVLSFFPTFGSITTSASFRDWGKWLSECEAAIEEAVHRVLSVLPACCERPNLEKVWFKYYY